MYTVILMIMTHLESEVMQCYLHFITVYNITAATDIQLFEHFHWHHESGGQPEQ